MPSTWKVEIERGAKPLTTPTTTTTTTTRYNRFVVSVVAVVGGEAEAGGTTVIEPRADLATAAGIETDRVGLPAVHGQGLGGEAPVAAFHVDQANGVLAELDPAGHLFEAVGLQVAPVAQPPIGLVAGPALEAGRLEGLRAGRKAEEQGRCEKGNVFHGRVV